MTASHAALWGLFGGFVVEGLDLYAAVRRKGCWPWRVRGPRETGALAYFVAELIRLVIGGGLAGAAATSGQLSTPLAALTMGIATPLIVERLARAVPLTDSEHGTAVGNMPSQSILSSTKVEQRLSPVSDTDQISQIDVHGKALE